MTRQSQPIRRPIRERPMKFLLFPLFAGVAAGALTFGAATFILEEPADAPAPPAAEAAAPAAAKSEPVAAADVAAPDAATPQVPPAPEDLTPEPPPRPKVLRQWTLPGQARDGA